MVSARCQQPIAVFIPGAVHDSRLVGVNCVEDLARLGLPQFDGLLTVLATADHDAFLRVPVTTLHVRPVAPQYFLLVAPLEVPDTNLDGELSTILTIGLLILTVPSSEQEANLASVGLNETRLIGSL